MTKKKTAYIHTAPTGLYHFTDDTFDYMDESGPGHETKADAQRVACNHGFTHIAGEGFREGGQRIPAKYRRIEWPRRRP